MQGPEQCHNTCFGSYAAHTDAKPTDALGGQTGCVIKHKDYHSQVSEFEQAEPLDYKVE